MNGGHEIVVLSASLVGRMLMTLKRRSTWIDRKGYQPSSAAGKTDGVGRIGTGSCGLDNRSLSICPSGSGYSEECSRNWISIPLAIDITQSVTIEISPTPLVTGQAASLVAESIVEVTMLWPNLLEAPGYRASSLLPSTAGEW